LVFVEQISSIFISLFHEYLNRLTLVLWLTVSSHGNLKGITMERPLSHLAHLEITSPDVEASAVFYEEKFGMRIVDRAEEKIYLRCWGDYYRYSLIVVPGEVASLARMAWRTNSAAALEAAAAQVEANGVQGTWSEGDLGYGRDYEFTGPYGHHMRLVYDVERFAADE